MPRDLLVDNRDLFVYTSPEVHDDTQFAELLKGLGNLCFRRPTELSRRPCHDPYWDVPLQNCVEIIHPTPNAAAGQERRQYNDRLLDALKISGEGGVECCFAECAPLVVGQLNVRRDDLM